MPFTVTKYPQGTFCWADVTSTDIVVTKNFMTGLLGWRAEDMPANNYGHYTQFFVEEHMVAGAGAYPPEMKGVPSSWNNYVSVDDIQATKDAAEELGAKTVMGPMEILDLGIMACIQDPQGAYIFLWQPKKHPGAGLVNTVGAMGWNELYTPDLKKSQEFYGCLFGWTFEASGDDYFIIKNNGRMNGGMMELTPEMAGMPPMWMTYFTVASIDSAIAKTNELGGQVHMTKDVPQGKLAMLADPTGASFFVIELSVPADEWVE